MMLVSLEQGKRHLGMVMEYEDANQDADIELKIEGASAAVLAYLKSRANEFLDSNDQVEIDSDGEPIGVPADVQAAVLLMLGYLFKDRDTNADNAYERGYLPAPVTALLYPKRDPAFR